MCKVLLLPRTPCCHILRQMKHAITIVMGLFPTHQRITYKTTRKFLHLALICYFTLIFNKSSSVRYTTLHFALNCTASCTNLHYILHCYLPSCKHTIGLQPQQLKPCGIRHRESGRTVAPIVFSTSHCRTASLP